MDGSELPPDLLAFAQLFLRGVLWIQTVVVDVEMSSRQIAPEPADLLLVHGEELLVVALKRDPVVLGGALEDLFGLHQKDVAFRELQVILWSESV